MLWWCLGDNEDDMCVMRYVYVLSDEFVEMLLWWGDSGETLLFY